MPSDELRHLPSRYARADDADDADIGLRSATTRRAPDSRPATLHSYRHRVQRVNDYLHAHLDEPLDLNHLAEIACLSPTHWHRVYHAMQGETIGVALRRLRLQRAAAELANTTRSIDSIATEAGYGSVAAFTRRFRSAYQLPPARYRSEGSHQRFKEPLDAPTLTHVDIEICHIDTASSAAIAHAGDYMNIGQAFDRLTSALSSTDIDPDTTRSFGVYFDDPGLVPEPELESLACVTVPDAHALRQLLSADDRIVHHELRGGKVAVLHHRGSFADLPAAYRWFFGHWLPASGLEVDDRPCVEQYLNDPRDTAPNDLKVDIHLPLMPR